MLFYHPDFANYILSALGFLKLQCGIWWNCCCSVYSVASFLQIEYIQFQLFVKSLSLTCLTGCQPGVLRQQAIAILDILKATDVDALPGCLKFPIEQNPFRLLVVFGFEAAPG